MKQTWVKVNGAWKKVKSAWVKINGIWKKDVIPKGVVSGNWKDFISYYSPFYRIRYGTGGTRLLNENFEEIKVQKSNSNYEGQVTIWAEVDPDYNIYVVPYLADNLSSQRIYKLDSELNEIYNIQQDYKGSTDAGYALDKDYWYCTFRDSLNVTVYDAHNGQRVKEIQGGTSGIVASKKLYDIAVSQGYIYRIMIDNDTIKLRKTSLSTDLVLKSVNLSSSSLRDYYKMIGGNKSILVTHTYQSSPYYISIKRYDNNLNLLKSIEIPASSKFDKISKIACGKNIFCAFQDKYNGNIYSGSFIKCYDYELNELWTYESDRELNQFFNISIDKNNIIYLIYKDSSTTDIIKFSTEGELVSTTKLQGKLSQFVIDPNMFSFPEAW